MKKTITRNIIFIIIFTFVFTCAFAQSSFAVSKPKMPSSFKVYNEANENNAGVNYIKVKSKSKGIQIYRKVNSGSFKRIYKGKASKFKGYDSNIKYGTTYRYKIRAYNTYTQYYNSKTKKWVNKKPKASQWKGKKKRTAYKYSKYTKTKKVSTKKLNTITANNISGTVGSSKLINATNTGNAPMSYKSSNSSIASVNSAGKVTFKSAGTVIITISCDPYKNYTGDSVYIKVTVKNKPTIDQTTPTMPSKPSEPTKPDTPTNPSTPTTPTEPSNPSVAVNTNNIPNSISTRGDYTFSVTPSNANISVSCSDSSILGVMKSGNKLTLTPYKNGTVTLSFKCLGEVVATKTINVNMNNSSSDDEVLSTYITLNKEYVMVNDTMTITANTNGYNGSVNYKGAYKWEIISGSDIVNITNNNGKTVTIKGKKEGTAKIKVTLDNGKSDTKLIDCLTDKSRYTYSLSMYKEHNFYSGNSSNPWVWVMVRTDNPDKDSISIVNEDDKSVIARDANDASIMRPSDIDRDDLSYLHNVYYDIEELPDRYNGEYVYLIKVSNRSIDENTRFRIKETNINNDHDVYKHSTQTWKPKVLNYEQEYDKWLNKFYNNRGAGTIEQQFSRVCNAIEATATYPYPHELSTPGLSSSLLSVNHYTSFKVSCQPYFVKNIWDSGNLRPIYDLAERFGISEVYDYDSAVDSGKFYQGEQVQSNDGRPVAGSKDCHAWIFTVRYDSNGKMIKHAYTICPINCKLLEDYPLTQITMSDFNPIPLA